MKKGITSGKANGLFGSNDPCTRGQIVTFLWRAAGSPAPKGTVKVPSDVLPGNNCTRGQIVAFLWRDMAE